MILTSSVPRVTTACSIILNQLTHGLKVSAEAIVQNIPGQDQSISQEKSQSLLRIKLMKPQIKMLRKTRKLVNKLMFVVIASSAMHQVTKV